MMQLMQGPLNRLEKITDIFVRGPVAERAHAERKPPVETRGGNEKPAALHNPGIQSLVQRVELRIILRARPRPEADYSELCGRKDLEVGRRLDQ